MKLTLYLFMFFNLLLLHENSIGQQDFLKPKQNNDPLIQAIKDNNLSEFYKLLNHGVNINGIYNNGTKTGTTAICVAACEGNLDIINELLNRKALVKIDTFYTYDALKEAVNCNKYYVVSFFLNNTTLYQNILEDDLETLLIKALVNDNIPTFNELLKKCSPSKQVNSYYTELLKTAIINNSYNLFLHLASMGGDIYDIDRNGETLLHDAANNLPIFKFLVSKGLDYNIPNKAGLLPIHLTENKEVIDFLASKNTDLNASDINGWTAMHYASFDGDWKVVNALLKNNADKNKLTTKNFSTIYSNIEISKNTSPLQLSQLILQKRADNLSETEKENYLKVIELLK